MIGTGKSKRPKTGQGATRAGGRGREWGVVVPQEGVSLGVTNTYWSQMLGMNSPTTL